MGKWANDNVMENGLNWIKNNCNEMHICSQQPTNFTEATSTYSLGSVAMSSSDFTLADGDTSGRKLTVAGKEISVSADGTITHVALVDTSTSTLMYVTTTNSESVSAGNTANVGSWDVEIGDPS